MIEVTSASGLDIACIGARPLLIPVFHHNALDLLTLAELLPHLLDRHT